MATGKSVNLRVRPTKSVDLSFPVDGVISWQPQNLLGTAVQGLGIEVLYSLLGQLGSSDKSRLLYDSERIRDYLSNELGYLPGAEISLLGQLRNASEAADLDRALMMRQNAYLTTYSP